MSSLAEKKRQFERILRLFPLANDKQQAYVEHALSRGWATLCWLPEATGKEKVLDVGSYRGLYGPAYTDVWNYAEVSLLGYDVKDNECIERSGLDGRICKMQARKCNIELEPFPFQDETFDVVVLTEVIEHMIFDPVFVMNEINRVLKPFGRLLFSVPNATSDSCLTFLVNGSQPGFLRQYISDALKTGERTINTVYNLGHFHEYTRSEVESLARSAGFLVERIGGITPFPVLLNSFRFRFLRLLVRALFPRSRRIREDIIMALLRKERYVPLDKLQDRYPAPLYRGL